MLQRERILVTVQTYPTISGAHIETVCTGGITKEGEWRRLYPVPLRYLTREQQYTTYDIVEVDVGPGSDGRPETREPHLPSLRVAGHVGDWENRRDWVAPTVFPSMRALRDAGRSIGPVAVTEVADFEVEPASGKWSPKQLEKLRQEMLFEDMKRMPLDKVPFDFFFRWTDGGGEEHRSRVLAWEMLQTWRAYRHRYDDPIPPMREVWLHKRCGSGREVSFFMGNYHNHRQWFGVTGVFCPPEQHEQQTGTLWAIGKR